MDKKIFREIIDLIKDSIWTEFSSSAEYREMLGKRMKVSDEIVNRLGGDELLDKYFAEYTDIEEEYQYFLCEKVLRAFVEIMSDIGVI